MPSLIAVWKIRPGKPAEIQSSPGFIAVFHCQAFYILDIDKLNFNLSV